MDAYAVNCGADSFRMRADFAQASCPIQIDCDDGWTDTPFQVADSRHSVWDAAVLCIEWMHAEGGFDLNDDGTAEDAILAIELLESARTHGR